MASICAGENMKTQAYQRMNTPRDPGIDVRALCLDERPVEVCTPKDNGALEYIDSFVSNDVCMVTPFDCIGHDVIKCSAYGNVDGVEDGAEKIYNDARR